MTILEKFKQKHKYYRIKSLLIKCNNDVDFIIYSYELQEYEIEYLIKIFNLNHWHWSSISCNQTLSEEFIEKYSDLVDWKLIYCNQTLSEEFKEKHKYYRIKSLLTKYDFLDYLLEKEKLQEFEIEYLVKNGLMYKLCWWFISANQKLSEEFIERHSDKVNWEWIFVYQNLSEDFIEKHKDKIK